MAAVSTIAIVGLGVAATSAVMQYDAGKKAAAAGRRQAEEMQAQGRIAQRQADLQNARQIRSAVRQARIARASMVNTAANAGTISSSGVLGGTGSLDSQLQSNLSFFGQMRELNEDANESKVRAGQAAGDAAVAQAESAQWGAIGSLGGTIFSGAGGFKTIFNAK